MLVNLNWVAVCTNYFSTCVLNSLHVFLPPLVFSSTVAVEFCFSDNVRLIRHVITNHVNCSELPPLWLSADQNFELCQSASHMKEVLFVILEELHISVKVIPTQSRIGRLQWLHISYLEKSEYFVWCIPSTTKFFFTKSCSTKCILLIVWELHSVSATQYDSYTVWQLHCVTATLCDSYTVWQLQIVTTTDCDNYTF